MSPPPDLSTDYLPSELVQLVAIASDELDRHVNEHGLCIICHEPWPCERACLAAFTLDAL